jgi:hypothetical protein
MDPKESHSGMTAVLCNGKIVLNRFLLPIILLTPVSGFSLTLSFQPKVIEKPSFLDLP